MIYVVALLIAATVTATLRMLRMEHDVALLRMERDHARRLLELSEVECHQLVHMIIDMRPDDVLVVGKSFGDGTGPN